MKSHRNKILEPVSQLSIKDGIWHATGNDPAFLINKKYKKGWKVIRWYSESSETIPLKFYWDTGEGFTEKNSTTFSFIPSGKGKHKAYFYFSDDVMKLRLDPGEKPVQFIVENFKISNVTKLSMTINAIKKVINKKGLSLRTLSLLFRKSVEEVKLNGIRSLWSKVNGTYKFLKINQEDNYSYWVLKHQLTEEKIELISSEIQTFEYTPLISVILPVYNVEEVWLRKCIDSVRNQIYSNWELCIADDASSKSHIRTILTEYMNNDKRIKVVFREKNGHISEASNSALELANGEFIALLDHDDELSNDALYENVKFLNKNPDTDLIYSDEDKIDKEGKRSSPYFKPDWSPDMILSQMYTCHLSVYRTSLVREIGGFRKGFEGSQDYDLVLRFTERTDRIGHISKILYHWRTIPESTASSSLAKGYTNDAGYNALNEAVKRRGYNATVEVPSDIPNIYTIKHYPINNPLISIIIPTRNMAEVLGKCIESIFNITSYNNYEVIVVDNGSDEKDLELLFEKWRGMEPNRFKVVRIDIPFNYSKLNNQAVAFANGELIVLLNNDIEIISEDWLRDMAGQACREGIGTVGACLLYPDNTIQHAGVIIGIGGVAGHSHKYFDAKNNGYFSRLRMISNYSAVTAACLMVKKSIYLEVGGLEEELAVAFNDVDFCLKIRETGYRNVWLPDVKMYHYESKSRGHEDTPEKVERFNKEIEYMKSKWKKKLDYDPCYNENLTKEKEDFSIEFSSV